MHHFHMFPERIASGVKFQADFTAEPFRREFVTKIFQMPHHVIFISKQFLTFGAFETRFFPTCRPTGWFTCNNR